MAAINFLVCHLITWEIICALFRRVTFLLTFSFTAFYGAWLNLLFSKAIKHLNNSFLVNKYRKWVTGM